MTYEFKPDDIRFNFSPFNSKEPQTRGNSTSCHSSQRSDEESEKYFDACELLSPRVESGAVSPHFYTPRTPRSFNREYATNSESEMSEMELSKMKALRMFGKRRLSQRRASKF